MRLSKSRFLAAIIIGVRFFSSDVLAAEHSPDFSGFEDTSEFSAPQPSPTPVIQTDADPTGTLTNTGTWSYVFELIAPDGTKKVLAKFHEDQLLKPASTQKLFTSWWAYSLHMRDNTYLSKMLHESVNAMAESIFTDLGGAIDLKKFLLSQNLPVSVATYIPVDGSGLSYNDQVTTSFEIHLLELIYAGTSYPDYKELLAQPKQYGTLNSRLGEFEGKLFAKTGTLADTACLSGFVETSAGEMIFSIISNGLKIDIGTARTKIDELVRIFAKKSGANEFSDDQHPVYP